MDTAKFRLGETLVVGGSDWWTGLSNHPSSVRERRRTLEGPLLLAQLHQAEALMKMLDPVKTPTFSTTSKLKTAKFSKPVKLSKTAILSIAAALVLTAPAFAQTPNTVFLDELTWMEVADKVDAGTTTIIVATAGTEQNGPHMVLGKHKFIVTETAERIARSLGNALVAPIVTYVPEGTVERTEGNRQRAGTITLPNEHYMKLLEYTARSLAAGGFTDVVFIGDSGGNQNGMETVAAMLNEEWSGREARVHFVGDYYSASRDTIRAFLQERGHTMEDIGTHAGMVDTSQLLYVNSRHIRTEELAPFGGFEGAGVRGDPTQASVAYGRVFIQMKVDAALRQIGELLSM